MTNQPILLIVDDKPANLKLLFEFLKQTGYRTLAAQSGSDALMLAEKSQPDLILLDVMMPELDGYETCQQLKENSLTKHIPVIFMTALSDTEHKLKAFQVGGIDFITKPLQHEEVLARVNAHLQLAALRKETDDFLNLLLQIAHQNTWDSVITACEDYLSLRPDIQAVAFWQKDPTTPELSCPLRQIIGPSVQASLMGALSKPPPILAKVVTTHSFPYAEDTTHWNRPDWAIENSIVAYTAAPLLHGDELVGVMAMFFNTPITNRLTAMLSRLRIFSNYLTTILFNIQELNLAQQACNQLEEENRELREEISIHGSFTNILGSSQALTRVLKQVELVAPTEANILISGESGTGKELIAQAIHQHSKRCDEPLIKVNCAAIPRELFESEFFGHVKGAFTGAVQNRKGRFQLADGGTIFLDEVGEIPIDLQSKLLRVIQEGTFERIGEEKSHHVDVRIIAATNRDLKKEISEGNFREDLYFRLSVIPIEVPPLRERDKDILQLAQHFIAQTCRKLGITPPAITPADEKALLTYAWPGNIRELQNELERAVILAQNGPLAVRAPFMGALSNASQPSPASTTDRIITEPEWDELQKQNIVRALEASNWRVDGAQGAAERLQLRPTTLRSRMKTMNIIKH